MLLGGNLAAFLLLLCLAQSVSSGHGAKAGGKRKKAERSSKTATGGKFTWKGNSQCAWAASGQDRYTLKVTCQPGEPADSRDGFHCEYTGEPGLCSAHSANPKAYWRQISRALQKQRRLCDAREPVRARACKGAPPGAHFKLAAGSATTTTTTTAASSPDGAALSQATPTPQCSERAREDYRRAAEEKCGESWQSVCTFLFTFVLSADC